MGGVDLDAEPPGHPPGGRLAVGRRADRRRVAPLGARAGERLDHGGGRRVARRADRQVDEPAGQGLPHRLELVEAVVGVRRRDERLGGSRSRHHVLGELAERGVVEPHPQPHAVVVGLLAEHLALAVHGGQHVAPVVGDGQLDHVGEGAQPVARR